MVSYMSGSAAAIAVFFFHQSHLLPYQLFIIISSFAVVWWLQNAIKTMRWEIILIIQIQNGIENSEFTIEGNDSQPRGVEKINLRKVNSDKMELPSSNERQDLFLEAVFCACKEVRAKIAHCKVSIWNWFTIGKVLELLFWALKKESTLVKQEIHCFIYSGFHPVKNPKPNWRKNNP